MPFRPSLQCRVALEVRKNNNKGGTRVLCVISPSEGQSQRESGLFILKTKLFSGNYLVSGPNNIPELGVALMR